MALNPLIPMGFQSPDISGGVRNALVTADQLETNETNRRFVDERIKTSAQERESRSRVLGAIRLDQFFKADDIPGAISYLEQREKELTESGRDPSTDTTIIKNMLQEGGEENVAKAKQLVEMAIDSGERMGLTNAPTVGAQKIFSNGTVVQSMSTGGSRTFLGDGTEVFGADALQAQIDANKAELQNRRDIADVDIDKVARSEQAKQAAQRDSNLISEISERNRTAARDQRRISEALQLSEQAAGGLTAPIKLKLSKLLPGIDVEDEAALDATLTQLALDQLQKFKGPTTDFEFNVTRDVAGRISEPKAARAAKLNSLNRAAWFNQREYDQFIKHQRAGGNSDNFSFNFGEEVKTKKGVFTLQDLQDTAVANNLSIEDVLDKLNQKAADDSN